MGLRKAWVLDSTIPTALAEELSADRCPRPFNFGVSASFEKKHEELELYSLSAWGDLEIESEYDWSHISVASRVQELKTRMKRHLRSRWASSLSTSYLEEDVKDLEYVAGGGLSANVGEGANNTLNQTHAGLICHSPDTDHVRTNSETVVTDTVADFLRQVEVLDRPTAHLSPVSPTAYLVNIPTPPSFPAPLDNNSPACSPACATNDNSDSETDYESSASAVLKTPCNSEDEGSDADVEVYTGDDLEKTPKKERNAKSVQSVISLRAASPQPKSTSKAGDELSQQLSATSDACAASLRAFAAYHTQREMLLGFQTDEDSDYEFDGAALQDGSPIFRQTLGPSFVSASHGAPRMPPRKPIPSWS